MLSLLSRPYFGASLVLSPEKGTYFECELFSETFWVCVNTLLKLTVKIAYNHVDTATARVRICVIFCVCVCVCVNSVLISL